MKLPARIERSLKRLDASATMSLRGTWSDESKFELGKIPAREMKCRSYLAGAALVIGLIGTYHVIGMSDSSL